MIVVHSRTSSFSLPEVEHRRPRRVLVHLSVADGDARLGDEALEPAALASDRLHAVVDEEDLPAARELAPDRRREEPLVERTDERPHGTAVGRRRLDDRQVADARQRHLERARDRRRRQRQDVDVDAHLAQLLLLRDAEAVLLVDDQQPEVLEPDVLREQAVRPDDDVDLPGLELRDDVRLLRRRRRSARASRPSPGTA